MEKENKLTYDEAIHIAHLEQAEALSMDEYKRSAKEAAELLQYCKSLLAEMHEDVAV